MSDAFTDMSRDNKLNSQISKIIGLEEEFCNFPSEKIANRIIKEYQEYIMNMLQKSSLIISQNYH